MVKPTSSCPSAFKIAAAALLSTPPLIATAIFIKAIAEVRMQSDELKKEFKLESAYNSSFCILTSSFPFAALRGRVLRLPLLLRKTGASET
jgi:hypothetical protein